MNEKATKQLIKTVKEATMRAKQQERREWKAVEAQEAIGRDAEAHANTIDIGKARTRHCLSVLLKDIDRHEGYEL